MFSRRRSPVRERKASRRRHHEHGRSSDSKEGKENRRAARGDASSNKVVDEWVERNLRSRKKGQRPDGALIVVGLPGSGKTTWARSFGEHVYMPCMFSSKDFQSSGGEYIVCDNIREDEVYAKVYANQVLGCQPVVAVRNEQGGVEYIEWGKPCIWICQPWDDPRRWNAGMAEFIKCSCTVFEVKSGWMSSWRPARSVHFRQEGEPSTVVKKVTNERRGGDDSEENSGGEAGTGSSLLPVVERSVGGTSEQGERADDSETECEEEEKKDEDDIFS